MSKEEREFLDALRTRSVEAASEILEGVQRLKSMYEEISDDGSGVPLPKPRLGDHFYQLAKFELEHASNLIRLGNSQAEMIFEHVRQLSRRAQKTTTSVVTLEPEVAAVRRGEEQHSGGRFEIKNPFDKAADLRFEVSALRTNDGKETGWSIKPRRSGEQGPVRAHESTWIELRAHTKDHFGETLFADLTVYLSADVEKQVARRVVKVRTAKEKPAADGERE